MDKVAEINGDFLTFENFISLRTNSTATGGVARQGSNNGFPAFLSFNGPRSLFSEFAIRGIMKINKKGDTSIIDPEFPIPSYWNRGGGMTNKRDGRGKGFQFLGDRAVKYRPNGKWKNVEPLMIDYPGVSEGYRIAGACTAGKQMYVSYTADYPSFESYIGTAKKVGGKLVVKKLFELDVFLDGLACYEMPAE